jgi:hypothetical protein
MTLFRLVRAEKVGCDCLGYQRFMLVFLSGTVIGTMVKEESLN